eukprot:TRINITY_DN50846_c0_g1_i1.p1 TRINITY_DN50846_c0_g1~~TRINITY_DN50846_c0_g1_i1.p1  ORF type:complete len:521 (+),score=80.79 TRINITY_DN50846_c0_g1_i1:167-1729(+)
MRPASAELALTARIAGFARRHMWREAVAVFEIAAGDWSRDMTAVGATISSSCVQTIGRRQVARSSVDASGTGDAGGQKGGHGAPVTRMTTRDYVRNMLAQNALIMVCARSRQWRQALQLLAQMARMRSTPSAAARRAAVRACGHAWQWALATLVSATRATDANAAKISLAGAGTTECRRYRTTGDDGSKSKPRARWSSKSTGCDSAVDCSFAVTTAAAIVACEKSSRWEAALALLSTQQLESVQLSGNHQIVNVSSTKRVSFRPLLGCNAALNACRRAARWQHALFLMWGAVVPSPSSTVATSHIALTASASVCSAATVLVDSIGINAAVAACEDTGNLREAFGCLRQDIAWRSDTFVTAAVASAASGALVARVFDRSLRRQAEKQVSSVKFERVGADVSLPLSSSSLFNSSFLDDSSSRLVSSSSSLLSEGPFLTRDRLVQFLGASTSGGAACVGLPPTSPARQFLHMCFASHFVSLLPAEPKNVWVAVCMSYSLRIGDGRRVPGGGSWVVMNSSTDPS